MRGIYYGSGTQVIGPYHADEFGPRSAAQRLMGQSGQQVYHIEADSYEDARRKLMNARVKRGH